MFPLISNESAWSNFFRNQVDGRSSILFVLPGQEQTIIDQTVMTFNNWIKSQALQQVQQKTWLSQYNNHSRLKINIKVQWCYSAWNQIRCTRLIGLLVTHIQVCCEIRGPLHCCSHRVWKKIVKLDLEKADLVWIWFTKYYWVTKSWSVKSYLCPRKTCISSSCICLMEAWVINRW